MKFLLFDMMDPDRAADVAKAGDKVWGSAPGQIKLLALVAATGLLASCVADGPSKADTELALYRWCFAHGLGDHFVKVVEIGSLADANPEETMSCGP